MLFPARSPWSGPRKQWNYAGTAYLSGCVESTRIDASAFGPVPLKLEDQGNWDPAEEYWGEQGEPIEKWAKPKDATRHYEVGFRIGELSVGASFDGLLPWGWIDNRPFLRCMHGFGLCLWRLGRFDEAGFIFDRMLWLNPSDNQGLQFLIDDIHAKIPYPAGHPKGTTFVAN